MRKLFIIGISLILLSIIKPLVWAQESVTLDRLVVTASRQEEETHKVPANITVVTAEQIEQSTAQNVAEVLSTLAGAHVMDTGGNKRNYWVDLRGNGESSPQNLLLLVDGRRVNLPNLSGPDWRLIPLERIERIEVMRGSRGTILYGDNATQGVINIITKAGQTLGGNFSAQYGSYDTYNVNAVASNAHGMLAYDLSAGYFDTDGYRDNSDSVAKDVGANLRVDPADKLRLHVSAGYHYDETRNPGAILDSQFDAGARRTDSFFPDDFLEVEDYFLKAGLEVDMLSNDMFKLEASFRNRDKKTHQSGTGFFFDADTQTDAVILSPQFIFREDFGGVSNRITIGGDYNISEQVSNSVSNTGSSVLSIEKENWGYYVQDDLSVGKRLRLSTGYRFDRVTYTYDPASPVRKRTFDEEGYLVGINYVIGPQSHLYGSFSHSFRYPVLDELFDFINNSVNTALLPQTTDDIEIGASAEVSPGFVLTLTFFRSESEDELFFNAISFANENMQGNVTRQGAELGLAWKYKTFSLGGTYTRTDIDIDGGQFDGHEYPFVPEDKLTATAGMQFDCGLSLGLEALYIGDRVLISDWDNTFSKADAYTVVNAKVQYQWQRYTFFVDLNNIFDEEYDTFSVFRPLAPADPGHYPAPDFNVLVGVSARFGNE